MRRREAKSQLTEAGHLSSAEWFLECLVEGKRRLRLPIFPLPFRIGRLHGLDLTLPWESVSKEHAEVYQNNEVLCLRDLHSTNGTFVNRKRIDHAAVREGDILHFADFEFRLGKQEPRDSVPSAEEERTTLALTGEAELPYHFVAGTRELGELLRQGAVSPRFRPLVTLAGGSLAGYEVLGRANHPGLPEGEEEVFRIAASVGAEADLSRVFRNRALDLVGHRTDLPTLFFRTHPSEIDRTSFFRSVRELRKRAPELDLVLEIRESAHADATFIANLRALLYELRMGLAYDDFRTSQGRLLELAEVPPDYLKFDESYVRGIDRAPTSKRRLLTSLVAAARDLIVQTVAQGIETAAEAEVCAGIGFTHAQGSYFGDPVPLEEIQPL